MPPFEVSDGSNGWVRVGRDQIAITGSTVKLQLGANTTTSPTSVRYAWADYVDCVLANSDGLPAGPFVAKISPVLRAVELPTKVAGLIQSPPLGTNTW
jgi:hypothetical protein